MRDDEPISDDYYPLRWRVADVLEDVFLLHRRAVVGVLALLALGVILIGVFGFGWGSSDLTQTDTTRTTAADNDEASSTTTTTSSTTTSTTTTTTTTSTTTTTTTTLPPVSERAATSAGQLAATEPGVILELTASEVRLVGGLISDDEADEQIELMTTFFPDLTVIDEQVVDESFPTIEGNDVIVARLSAPDLFGYNSDEINQAYLPVIDQLAAAIQSFGWSVEVSGHTDDSGPAPGNLRLSERRAASAAQRLINQGAPPANVTSIGRGEEDPVASNDTEAGRLENRRVEFLLTA